MPHDVGYLASGCIKARRRRNVSPSFSVNQSILSVIPQSFVAEKPRPAACLIFCPRSAAVSHTRGRADALIDK